MKIRIDEVHTSDGSYGRFTVSMDNKVLCRGGYDAYSLEDMIPGRDLFYAGDLKDLLETLGHDVEMTSVEDDD